MYFSSLKDDELDYFHKTINASFTMSLTDILSSDLFKVDEVVEDVLYRIYPLFYCTNAISSNPKDKILDNKCFICTVGEHETYMSFTKGDGDNLIIDESSMTLHDIGDSLSADEFNAMVYRLRSKEVLTGTLNFEESTRLTGLYGTYELLHTENQPRNDYGYIINDNVKDTPLTVKLTNPFFDSANYKLTFTVKSITGANIFDETSEQYIDTDEFTITLTKDEEVAIDLTEYTNDSVLLYDVKVEVDFKTVEFTNDEYTLTLTSSPSQVYYYDDVTLTTTLSSTESTVTGFIVQFYEGSTLLDTETTDANGQASTTITTPSIGSHNYKAVCLGVQASTDVYINRYTPQLTVTANDITLGQTLTVNITSNVNLGSPLLRVFVDGVRTTNCYMDGTTATATITGLTVGQHIIKVTYGGNLIYNSAESNKTITVNKCETRFNNISINGASFSGVLEYKNGNGNWVGLGSKQFYYTIREGAGGSNLTSNDGTFSLTWYWQITEPILFTFKGDSEYEPCSKQASP